MTKPNTDQEIRATCKILESVAESYPRRSTEYKAIRKAAYAFIFLRLHKNLKRSYELFRKNSTKPLTKAQRQVLKQVLMKAGVK
jgi:hypothetical protein